MATSFNKFYGKMWNGFGLNTKKMLPRRGFILKRIERLSVSLKTVLRILKKALRLIDWHVFMWQSLDIFNVFNSLVLKQVLRKTETFFKKLEDCLLVQSTTNESATFPYKTGLSKANVKKIGMGSTKWTYYKERTFATDYFIFLRI